MTKARRIPGKKPITTCDSASLHERGFSDILPSCVSTSHRLNDDGVLDILPPEQAIVAGAIQARRQEFRTGRHCAREALTQLGIPSTAIPAGAHGEPLWPPAIVGSITHCNGYRAAAVARDSQIRSLGIDVETQDPLPPGVLTEVALPDEQAEMHELRATLPMVHWDRVLFSMKETIYKSWFPLHRRWLSFTDCRVRIDPHHGTFSAHVLVESGPGWPISVRGTWETSDMFIRTAAWVSATPPDRSLTCTSAETVHTQTPCCKSTHFSSGPINSRRLRMTMTTSQANTEVAVIGTGTMGSPIARNLHKAGFEVTVWNRSAAKAAPLSADGVALASSLADAVSNARVVVTVLKDADAVLEVLQAAGKSLRPGTVLVQISTVGVDGIARIAEFAKSQGLRLIDAPVQGTKGPAEKAQLVILASGAEDDRGVVDPLFDAIGQKTLWVADEPGEASKLKVVVNSFISALTHGIAEAVRLAEALEVDVEDFQRAILGGPLVSPFSSIKLNAIMNQQFTPSFTVDNAIKDSQLVVEAAENVKVWLPVADAGLKRYRAAAAAGHGGEDMAASYFAENTVAGNHYAS